MNPNDWNLDELVGKVMADLRGATSPVDDSAARASAALSSDFRGLRARAADAPTPEDDAFSVAERLLVAETVRRIAASTSAKRWRVREGVVVTPAARDELKKAGVALIFVDKAAPVASVSASNVAVGGFRAPTSGLASRRVANFSILSVVCLPQGERLPKFVDDYLTRNFAIETLRLDCLKESSKRIAAALEKNKETRAILTTRDAAIGAIWTNRLSGVRSVVAFSAEQARRDFAAANANVAIVDPRDVGPYPFRQIVENFLTRGR